MGSPFPGGLTTRAGARAGNGEDWHLGDRVGEHTRLILATQPWSQEIMVDEFIWAIPMAVASPLVVMITSGAR